MLAWRRRLLGGWDTQRDGAVGKETLQHCLRTSPATRPRLPAWSSVSEVGNCRITACELRLLDAVLRGVGLVYWRHVGVPSLGVAMPVGVGNACSGQAYAVKPDLSCGRLGKATCVAVPGTGMPRHAAAGCSAVSQGRRKPGAVLVGAVTGPGGLRLAQAGRRCQVALPIRTPFTLSPTKQAGVDLSSGCCQKQGRLQWARSRHLDEHCPVLELLSERSRTVDLAAKTARLQTNSRGDSPDSKTLVAAGLSRSRALKQRAPSL